MPKQNGGARPGAGRKPGGSNQNGPDIKTIARQYTGLCMTTLVNIAKKSKNESNKIAAVTQILDRGFGKPTQAMGVDPDTPTGKFTISWEK